MLEFPDINLLAVLAAAVVEVVIGAVWFNAPFAFSGPWLAGIGKTTEQVAEDASPLSIVAAVVGAVITALVMAVVIGWAGADTAPAGLLVGLMMAIGFSANTAWIKDGFEGRPLQLTLINTGHDAVILALMGLILGAWQ